MTDTLERFFNWQTDMDWAWGPFLGLRPPRDRPLQPWVWTRLFVAFTLLGLLLLALAALSVVLLPKLAAAQHWAVPPGVVETRATLLTMAAERGFQWTMAGLLLSLPGLFFLACLPFHAAWNRRAARLAALPAAETPTAHSEGDVWPPAPKNS